MQSRIIYKTDCTGDVRQRTFRSSIMRPLHLALLCCICCISHYSAFDDTVTAPYDIETASHDFTATSDDDIKTTSAKNSEDVQPPYAVMRRAADYAKTPVDQLVTTHGVNTADDVKTADDDDDDDDDDYYYNNDVRTASLNVITPDDCIKVPEFVIDTPNDTKNTFGDIEIAVAQILINAFKQGSYITFLQSLKGVVSSIHARKINVTLQKQDDAGSWDLWDVETGKSKSISALVKPLIFPDVDPNHVLVCPRPSYKDNEACNQREIPRNLVDDCLLDNNIHNINLTFLYWSDYTCFASNDSESSESIDLAVYEPPSPALAVPAAILCMLTYGSLTHPPTALICVLPQTYKIQSLLVQECGISQDLKWKMKLVNASGTCTRNEEIHTQKVLWGCAKVNYSILGGDIVVVCVMLIRYQLIKGTKTSRRYILAFVLMNLVWVTWRLQETLDWDMNWRANNPYACIFTNYVRYGVEAGVLYRFACTSLHRLHAVARPLKWRSRPIPQLLDAAAISSGVLVGLIISTLNLMALLYMGDDQIVKFCRFTHDAAKTPLHFLMVVKVLNLLLVFVLPFMGIILSNGAMFVAFQMSKKKMACIRQTSRKCRKQSATFSWMFLFASCIIIACCLATPTTELKLAAETHQSGRLAERSAAESIAQGVLWNLTSFAYMMVTLTGIKHSPHN